MKILVNAYNLRIGGGESVGIGIISSIYTINTENQYVILTNNNESYQSFTSKENINIHHVPNFFTYYWLGNLLSPLYLFYIAIRINPDVIFSLGNYAIPTRKKQLLFLHWPYIVYPDSIAWKKQKGSFDYLKRKVRLWFMKNQFRFATAITVQTPLMKKQFLTHFSQPNRIHVVESAVSKMATNEYNTSPILDKIDTLKTQYKAHLFLLCLTKYYTHKNIEVLVPLAEEIRKNNAPYKIFTNLDPYQHHKAKQFLKTIQEKKLDHIIINIGTIPQSSLYQVYQKADGFILPTLLESFGIIYREAMSAGIPIFTSDLDFAHEACGNAAFYFDPSDPVSIYQTLVKGYGNQEELKTKTAVGQQQALHFLSWNSITKAYIDILHSL